jgi:4-hydroxy-tetrahydrodipicolinate reductase
MLRVGVLGAGGRMGEEVCRAVGADPGLVLAAAIDPQRQLELGTMSGGADTVVSTRREALREAEVAVVVDFTVAGAARENLPWCAAEGMHAVIGTTGFSEADLTMLTTAFDGQRANAVLAANFAIGAVLLLRMCELVAPYMESAEIIELHHDQKRDAPSGTALATAAALGAARDRAGGSAPPDPTTHLVLEGARGARTAEGINVHSVRLPGLVAHEEVIFGSAGQTLTLRHDSYDRRSFMAGVLLAVHAVSGRPGLTVGLESLLGL